MHQIQKEVSRVNPKMNLAISESSGPGSRQLCSMAGVGRGPARHCYCGKDLEILNAVSPGWVITHDAAAQIELCPCKTA